MKAINIQIGQTIRKYREMKGMTQLQVAEKLGYESTQFISLCERGLSKVPIETMGTLAVVLDIPKTKLINVLVNDYKDQATKQFEAGIRKMM